MTSFPFNPERTVTTRLKIAAAAALLVLATACGTTDAPNSLEPPAGGLGRVRFVNVITDTTRARVNMSLAGTPWNVNQVYTNVTPVTLAAPNTGLYSAIRVGQSSLVLRRTADTSVIVSTIAVDIAADGADHTVYGIGGAGATPVTGFITRDTNTVPTAGNARVRVVHLAPTAGNVDIFVTAVGADLALATPTLANVPFRTASGYLSVPAATYQVRVVPAGTAAAARAAAVAINVASLAIPALGNRTIVAADNNIGGAPLRAFVLTDR
jgi:Domain of unknown function (DUF4397)